MSAFLVDRVHIDVLVSLAAEHRPPSRFYWYHCDMPHYAEDCDAIGRMLWTENLRSVSYRYPDDASGERPGPTGLQDAEIEAYFYIRPRYRLTPVEGLAAIRGYVYQACEHPEWKASEASAFCEALLHAMIRWLPGYDAAPWTWTRAELAKRTLARRVG